MLCRWLVPDRRPRDARRRRLFLVCRPRRRCDQVGWPPDRTVEVERALIEHPAVAEAGVIGRPDPVAGELVNAFISLKPGYVPGEPLARELLGHARKRLGPAVAPKEIAFSADLPRTRSGKIMRRLLRARELGLPEGDLSTLEEASSAA